MDVFLSSPWVPAEWVRAHGLTPRGVWSLAEPGGEDLALGAGVCAFAHALERWAEAHPEAAFIFSTHCDQLRRGFDGVAGSGASEKPIQPQRHGEHREGEKGDAVPTGRDSIPRVPTRTASPPASQLDSCRAKPRAFLFNLPATWQSVAARQLFSAELERLGRFLIGLGGHPPANGELNRLLAESNAARAQLLEAAAGCPARAFAAAVARFHWDGSVCLPAASAPPPAAAIPLALLGGPLSPAHWNWLDGLEKAGGRIVLNATECGERSLGFFPTPADGEVTLQALAQGCLETCVDVFQRPNTRLYEWLKPRLAARGVRGLILWHYVGCDLWRAEAQSLRETLGLPLLALDADETASAATRTTTRIEAFLESLRTYSGFQPRANQIEDEHEDDDEEDLKGHCAPGWKVG